MKKLSFLKCFVETLLSASESLVKTLPATSLLGMLLLAPTGASAQVTVGAGTMPAATLDVVASAPGDATVPEGVMVPRLTKAQINAKQASYTAAQTDATVYVTDFSAPSVSGYSDRISCIGFAYWSGTQWVMNCDATTKTFVEAVTQPQPFTFYEQGTETPVALTFVVTGTSAITYQWRKIVGSNIHVRISEPCTAADGTGFDSASFTPTGVIKGTTEDANNTGFYRYFCVATDQTGDEVTSNLAEVAVGCGAKDLNGEWLSFMCHNLGANANTMATQKSTGITLIDNGSVTANTFLRSANERTLYGDLYQWGRIADGHENRNAIPLNGTGGVNATDNCVDWASTITFENGAVLSGNYFPFQQVTRGSTFYGKFIKTTAANNNSWYLNSVITQTNADLLWRTSTFAPNDPCQKVKTDGTVPSGNVAEWYPTSVAGISSGTGWRIPTQGEWAALYRGSTSSGLPASALANTWTWYQQAAGIAQGTKGYEVKPDGVTTTLFLPASGRRNPITADLRNLGANGYYWSSNISGDASAFGLLVYAQGINPANIDSRGFGYALRCIKN